MLQTASTCLWIGSSHLRWSNCLWPLFSLRRAGSASVCNTALTVFVHQAPRQRFTTTHHLSSGRGPSPGEVSRPPPPHGSDCCIPHRNLGALPEGRLRVPRRPLCVRRPSLVCTRPPAGQAPCHAHMDAPDLLEFQQGPLPRASAPAQGWEDGEMQRLKLILDAPLGQPHRAFGKTVIPAGLYGLAALFVVATESLHVRPQDFHARGARDLHHPAEQRRWQCPSTLL